MTQAAEGRFPPEGGRKGGRPPSAGRAGAPCGLPEAGAPPGRSPAIARVIYRSVNLSSMRRFFASASGLSPGSIGWYSPKPVAASRSGGRPWTSTM